MLNLFKRMEKTRSAILLVFAIVMVASLVLFYAPTSSDNTTTLAMSQDTAAKVSGENISVAEVVREKEGATQFTGGRSLPAKLVLDSLISSRIGRIEAARLGLTASNAEVAAAIRDQFKPQDGTAFNQTTYEQNVTAQYGSVSAFEELMRDDLSARKLNAFITAGVTVSEDEVLKDFQRRQTKFDLSYVMVNAAELAEKITPTDEELKANFEKNKQSFYINSPQKKIRYIFINTTKIGEKLNITDADLQAEYNQLPEDKKTGGVLGQEVVLRVSKPEFDGQVSEKATGLVARLREQAQEGVVTEAAFAEIAKGHSENQASAQDGGKLRGPVRENLNKPDDPYQRLLTMKPGEVTDPINYEGRYFILRRGEAVAKPFDDAKKELEVSLRNRRAYAAAAELAQKVTDTLKTNKDIQKTAEEFAAQANMSVTDMVRETGYVKPNDNVANIGNSPQFESGIAGLENANDVGEKIPIQNGFAIPQLVDKKDPRDADFDEVKDQVTEQTKLELARTRIEEIAKKVAAGATSASALSGSAEAENLKAQEQKGYTVGTPLGQGPSASTSEALGNAIYAMKAGEATKTPIKVGDNWLIVGVNSREDASMDEFAKGKQALSDQLLSIKRNQVFSDYISATRKRFEDNGSITIYQDQLTRIDQASAANAPQLPPNQQMPPGLQLPIE